MRAQDATPCLQLTHSLTDRRERTMMLAKGFAANLQLAGVGYTEFYWFRISGGRVVD